MRQDVKIGVRGYTVWYQFYIYLGFTTNVDRVCLQYLHYFTHFEIFFILYYYLFVFISNLLFQGHDILFLVWALILTWPFCGRRQFPAILLAATDKTRQRGLQLYLHPLEAVKCMMSVNKLYYYDEHSSGSFRTRSVERSYESQQCRCR